MSRAIAAPKKPTSKKLWRYDQHAECRDDLPILRQCHASPFAAAECPRVKQDGGGHVPVSLHDLQSAFLGEHLALVGLEVFQVPALPESRSHYLVAQSAASELLEKIAHYAGREAAPLCALPLQFREFPAAIADREHGSGHSRGRPGQRERLACDAGDDLAFLAG
jgi:hypothetical protein